MQQITNVEKIRYFMLRKHCVKNLGKFKVALKTYGEQWDIFIACLCKMNNFIYELSVHIFYLLMLMQNEIFNLDF